MDDQDDNNSDTGEKSDTGDNSDYSDHSSNPKICASHIASNKTKTTSYVTNNAPATCSTLAQDSNNYYVTKLKVVDNKTVIDKLTDTNLSAVCGETIINYCCICHATTTNKHPHQLLVACCKHKQHNYHKHRHRRSFVALMCWFYSLLWALTTPQSRYVSQRQAKTTTKLPQAKLQYKCDRQNNFIVHNNYKQAIAVLTLTLIAAATTAAAAATATIDDNAASSNLQLISLEPSDDWSRAMLATMSTQAPLSLSNANGEPSAALSHINDDLDSFAASLQLSASASRSNSSSSSSSSPSPSSSSSDKPATFLEQIHYGGKVLIMLAIMICDICGNSLVILSVCRHKKLRVTTNWFVVSLACADILVAFFAMTFNSSVSISNGRWLFNRWVCDFWTSSDVLFSTASILHLCCISIDRYIAIITPLDYPMKITTRRVVYMICCVWIASALLSYIPIFTGIYTTEEHLAWSAANPDKCELVVNRAYAIVSSSVSFWIPCCIMVFTYYRIYREASRQEKFIHKTQAMLVPHAQYTSSSYSYSNSNNANLPANLALANTKSSLASQTGSMHCSVTSSRGVVGNLNAKKRRLFSRFRSSSSRSAAALAKSQGQAANPSQSQHKASSQPLMATTNLDCASSNSNESNLKRLTDPAADTNIHQQQQQQTSWTPTRQSASISKMKREHKAAKTLGIIMGVFILCWLPFFVWYTSQNICGPRCDNMMPESMVTFLFWIGYFNSALNPIIYAYFNSEFRKAFKQTLEWIFCCSRKLTCFGLCSSSSSSLSAATNYPNNNNRNNSDTIDFGDRDQLKLHANWEQFRTNNKKQNSSVMSNNNFTRQQTNNDSNKFYLANELFANNNNSTDANNLNCCPASSSSSSNIKLSFAQRNLAAKAAQDFAPSAPMVVVQSLPPTLAVATSSSLASNEQGFNSKPEVTQQSQANSNESSNKNYKQTKKEHESENNDDNEQNVVA